MLSSFNPATGELIGSVPTTTEEELDIMILKSKQAQQKWQQISIDKRIEILIKAGNLLESKAQEIGMLLSIEMGKSFSRGIGEVSGCAGSIKYVAESVKDAVKPIEMNYYGGSKTTIQYNPIGVCGIIAPWNYPVSMAHWMIIPALTAGNSVILKPSEETPLVAKAYVDTINEVLPENLLQIAFGDEKIGKKLVESNTDFIGFTGSMEAGRNIMCTAANQLKPLIMELGGKDPLIVLEDADPKRAARFAVANSVENAGQMCISTERIFVHKNIAERFKEAAAAVLQKYKVGPCTDQSASIGPIINERQRQRILDQIDDALEKGAHIFAGNCNHAERYINPLIITEISEDMKIYSEETFGPLICIMEFDDIEDVIKRANDTEFGLGAVVMGEKDAHYVASKLQVGMVGINTSAGGGVDTPWVGAKQSGIGYHGSPDGHRQFTQPKVISEG